MGNAKLDRREHYIVADSSDKMHHTEGYYPNALLQYRCNPAHTTTCRVRWILVLRPSALSFTYTTKPTNQKEMHFSTYGDTIACLHTIYSYEWMVAFLRTHLPMHSVAEQMHSAQRRTIHSSSNSSSSSSRYVSDVASHEMANINATLCTSYIDSVCSSGSKTI